jgi:hypothetical protein
MVVSCNLAEVHKLMNCWFQKFPAWSYCSYISLGFRGIGTDSSTAGIADLCGYLEYEWSGLWQNIENNMINFSLVMCYIYLIKSMHICVKSEILFQSMDFPIQFFVILYKPIICQSAIYI